MSAEGPAVGPRWNGWLFVADRHWLLDNPDHLGPLSRGTRMLRFAVEEHVMFTEAALWLNGREEWAVTGDMDVEEPVVATRGTPPDELPRAEQLESRSDDPMPFNVPVLLIKLMTGWQYDEPQPDLEDAPAVTLLGLEIRDPLAGLNLVAAVRPPVMRREPLSVRWWRRLRGR